MLRAWEGSENSSVVCTSIQRTHFGFQASPQIAEVGFFPFLPPSNRGPAVETASPLIRCSVVLEVNIVPKASTFLPSGAKRRLESLTGCLQQLWGLWCVYAACTGKEITRQTKQSGTLKQLAVVLVQTRMVFPKYYSAFLLVLESISPTVFHLFSSDRGLP